MIAVPMTCKDFSEPRAPTPSSLPAPFAPLDPGVLNASIPAFFIGRDSDGFWLARDVRGQTGGIFLLESSALAFARRQSWPSGCATIYTSERFELDVKNRGNPLVIYFRPLVRLVAQGLRRSAAWAARLADAIGSRF